MHVSPGAQTNRIMKELRIVRIASALVMMASVLAACGIESYQSAADDFNANSPPAPPPPTTVPPPPPPPGGGSFGPNFSEIQSNVFTPSCASANCHAGGGASAGLNLEAANSYAELVGIASTQDSATQRVNAGSPINSYLIHKLENTAVTGAQMPPGGTPLPQTSIDIIRQWITDGAIDDRVVVLSPIRVTSMSPGPGATLTAAPTQIVAGFDRNLDATTVNANTFTLMASGGDSIFGNGNDIQIAAATISVPNGNSMTAVFSLGGVVLADETYQIRLFGTGGSLIMDQDANALDGEYVGVFPAGNGTAGGDFVSNFVINTPVVIGPTLDQIQTIVFTPTCATATCHTGPSGNNLPAGLDLSNADASFASLLGLGNGVPSLQQAAILRVAPNDPDNSYLIQKMEGVAATGGIMPPIGGLDPTVIAEIRQWIADGALRQ